MLVSGIFKRFVSRAKTLCPEKYLEEEENFLIDTFVENEHNQNYLNSIGKEIEHQATKTENTDDNNIVKLPWIPIMEPKIRKELRKTRRKVIFTSAAKLKKYCIMQQKSKVYSYPGV